MAKVVIKKSGKKQKFNPKKIKKSIEYAAKQSRISKRVQEAVIKKTIKEVFTYLDTVNESTTAQIRDIILQKLNSLNPAVVRAWLAYEMQKLSGKKVQN